MSADAPRDPLDQLIVDFPTAASLRPTPTVRFASSPPVLPIRSASATNPQQDDLVFEDRYSDDEATEEIRRSHSTKDTPRTS